MESNQDLENFFKQNANKKKGKGKGKKAKPAPVEQAQPEEKSKPEAVAAPEKQAPIAQQHEDDASSDEDQIVINEGQQKIKDKKEIEQKTKNQSIENEGWRPGGNFGKSNQQAAADGASKDGAQASAQGSGPIRRNQGGPGGINFGGGKFTFTKQSKGGAAIGDAMNFPSLGESANKPAQNQPAQSSNAAGKGNSKASGPMMFTSDNLNQGNQQKKPQEEVKQAPSRPTFTGKAKIHASNDQTPASSTNYDFSSMRMSAATSGKRHEGEGGNREDQPRQRRDRPAQQNNDAFSGDEDFEVVKEKKKREVRRPERTGGDFAFGQAGGPPRFNRGGEQQ